MRTVNEFQKMAKQVHGRHPAVKTLVDSFKYGRNIKNEKLCKKKYKCSQTRDAFCEEISSACPVLKVIYVISSVSFYIQSINLYI